MHAHTDGKGYLYKRESTARIQQMDVTGGNTSEHTPTRTQKHTVQRWMGLKGLPSNMKWIKNSLKTDACQNAET